MKFHVFLEFLNGLREEAWLDKIFDPCGHTIYALFAKDGIKRNIGYSELCCILTNNVPEDVLSVLDKKNINTSTSLEEIEIISGKQFHVRVFDKKKYNSGFFARSIESSSSFKYIFFFFNGFRMCKKYSSTGEILKQKGLLSETAIDKALDNQKKLKTMRVGEILKEKNELSADNIEQTIANSNKTLQTRNLRVGDLLIEENLVTRQQVDEALSSQRQGEKKRIGELLVECSFVTEEQVLGALATKFCMPYSEKLDVIPDTKLLSALPKELIYRLEIFPVKVTKDSLFVAISRPTDPAIGDFIRFSTKKKIEFVVTTSKNILWAIEKYYPRNKVVLSELIDKPDDIIQEVEEDSYSNINETDSKIITLVNKILFEAYHDRASDIHFEPGQGKNLLIRYRIDGICTEMYKIPHGYSKALISRVKIIANLDIAEHRLPQSGKILLKNKGLKIEYRVEITPTVGGNEDVVLRILSAAKPLPIKKMGFSSRNIIEFEKILKKPYGLILCVGPTGSGKTTTLHSALGYINNPEVKIWTVEDPVEITQEGLRQVQVYSKIGFTFSKALRSFLRADPDVIMVGEMRDSETAQIVIQSALTGHLVLSTLHTNSAPEAITRLIEMGIDPLHFSDALLGVLAQRLTRQLCSYCKKSYHPDYDEYMQLVTDYGKEQFEKDISLPYKDDLVLNRASGCEQCNQTGYMGRIAIHELLIGTDEIKSAIKKRLPAEELFEIALKNSMKTLRTDGISKVFQGATDYHQVLRVCI